MSIQVLELSPNYATLLASLRSAWISGGDGWIDLGEDDFSRSRVRILDIDDMIWQSDKR